MISTTANKHQYTGNGTTTSFPYLFKIFSASDLAVIKYEGGTETVLTLNVDYTVTGVGNDSGGSVNFVLAPSSTAIITIVRDISFLQTDFEYQEGFAFNAAGANSVLDRLVMMVQKLEERVRRGLSLRRSATVSDLTLPDPVASKFLAWNDTGTGLENTDPGSAGGGGLSIHDLPSKTTPTDTDITIIEDSASAWAQKKLSWGNLKATLKAYFDTIYTGGSSLSIHDLSSKTTPTDADIFVIEDSAASWAQKQLSWQNIKIALNSYFSTFFAPYSKGVTNGDAHNHDGGDGGPIDHGVLLNIGSNTHAQIDNHISSTGNPHSVTATQILPSQSGNSGKALITNGTSVSWGVPSRAFTPLSLADDSYVGDTIAGTAGEALAQWDAVYLKSDGKFWKAKADSSTTCPADGVTVAAASANGSVTVLVNGFFRDDGGPTLTVGGLIYLSTATAGAITNTVPSTSGHQGQILGRALAAQIRHIKPSLILVEVP